MHFHDLLNVFQGLQTFLSSDPIIIAARLGLIVLGIVLVILACRGTLEPLLMIPMGFGMIAANAGVLILDPVTTTHIEHGTAHPPAIVAPADPSANPVVSSATTPTADKDKQEQGTLFVAPLVEHTDDLMYMLQVDFLQPIYTLTFSNGLIACLVFMGIGALLDTSYLLARPMQSMFLALCAELGTILTFPIALMCKLPVGESAAIAMVGGADGPMVMFTSLVLARDAFVPITVVAYLYLGLTYGGYPYLIKLLIPKKLRATATKSQSRPEVPARHKIIFAMVACTGLCLLFPIAAPLFLSLFLGVAVREANIVPFVNLITGPILYGSTFFLGLMLGVLCEAHIILDPTVLLLLVLGIVSLLLSGIGGILGGYILYFWYKRQYNPVIGIAGVSCVPTTAKVAQKIIAAENPSQLILAEALGANISGVITSAIICGLYLTVIPLLSHPH